MALGTSRRSPAALQLCSCTLKYRDVSQDCACGRQMTPTHMKAIYELQHGFPRKKRVNVFDEIDEFFTKEVDARAQGMMVVGRMLIFES